MTSGTAYYVKVCGYGSSFDITNKYRFRAKLYLQTYHYFSQKSSAQTYNTTNLDILYNSTSMISWKSYINDSGCVMASYAIVLKNLGATTSQKRYDIRNGITDYLQPDPFTVTYANMDFPEITFSNGKYTTNRSGSPVAAQGSTPITGFGKAYSKVDISGTDADKANEIAYQLSLHPEGVAVSFATGKSTHTLVFTQTTHEVPVGFTPTPASKMINLEDEFITSLLDHDAVAEWQESFENKIAMPGAAATSSYDSSFTVYDPAMSSGGAGILFANFWTKSAHGFGAAYRIRIID